jgi:serine/threonine protein kinase
MVMETLPSGTILKGRYRVERVLGNGGFGHVYLAIDLQTGRQYAVKEYLVTGSSGKAQLEHESRVLSQLHHASLPAFQDAFDERGRYYVVLGYIEGRDLTDCIRAARTRGESVSLERILNWLISICDAVTFLHSQSPPIIHRDIKPDNIRIMPNGTAILVDLGNAKAADGARTLLFIRHQGTPGYAPLEQYPGGTGTDSRSDVYALGGTLYFALTGHEPPSVSARKQSSDQGMSDDLPSLQEILEQNPPETAQDPNANRQFRLGINKPAKPAPRHSRHIAQLGTLSPDLLNRLNLIIKRAMKMDPWERYQTVAELSADLQRVRAALPSSTQPAPPPVRRPIDPHSTQPDLQFAFENLQNQNQAPPTPDNAGRTDRPGAPPVTPDMMTRCPRCQMEVTRTAQFCPRCGSSLNNTAPQNFQESTLVINPQAAQVRPIATPSMPVSTPKEMENAFSSPPPHTPGMSPSTGSAMSPPLIVRASTPPLSPGGSRPFVQQVGAQPSPVMPGSATVQPSPHSGAQRGQPSPPAPVASTREFRAPGGTSQSAGSGSPKWLLYGVAALILVIVVVLIVVLVHGGADKKNGNVAPLPLAHAYFVETQVYHYERNISLCSTSTAAHSGAGVRQCHTGISASPGIAERVAGPRVGPAAYDYRSRLAQAGTLHSS